MKKMLKILPVWLLCGAAYAGPSWDIQFEEPFNFSRDVWMMDLDGEFTAAEDVAALRERSVTPICYVAVGTWENYRGDAQDFPDELLGKTWPEWPDERYLDIRNLDKLLPLMRARFEMCRDKGFLGIEADVQDLHWADTGFPIKREHQVAYSQELANMAHEMGMTFGQKNSPDLVDDLIGYSDFIVTEDCFYNGWCDDVLPYVAAGKPVFAIEYTDTGVDFAKACAYGRETGIDFILKDRDLNGDAYRACN